MKNIFLVGYYGFNNFGDELLLKTILKLLGEIGFEGRIYIPADEKTNINEEYDFTIEYTKRFDILKNHKIIKDSDLIIFGGGNLFQSETSFKSFIYYYDIGRIAAKYNKKILMISQGFGPMMRKIEFSMLKNVINYENFYGIYRDYPSYIFSKKYNPGNSFDGVDIAPYYVGKRTSDIKDTISICLKNDYSGFDGLIKFMNIFEADPISTLIINVEKDYEISDNFISELKKQTALNVNQPVTTHGEVIENIALSKLVISDRLHSALIPLYFGVPTLTYKNSKNVRVLKNISKDYNYFYKNFDELAFSYGRMLDDEFDFNGLSEKYHHEMHKTIQLTRKMLNKLLG